MKISNYTKSYILNALYSTALLFSSGTIIQVFLTALNVSSGEVGLYVTITNSIQVIIMLLFSGMGDKIKDVKKALSILTLAVGIVFPVMLPFCFLNGTNPLIVFAVALIAAVLQGIFIGFKTMLDYKFPYLIYDMERYDTYLAINGIITGIVGIITTTLMSFVFDKFPYFTVVAVIFVIGIIFSIVAASINQTYVVNKETLQNAQSNKQIKASNVLELLKFKGFSSLIAPNFLRGFASGIISIAAVIGIAETDMSITTANYLVTASTIATTVGCLLYALLVNISSARVTCLVGSILIGVSLPLMLFKGSYIVFIIMYFVSVLGRTFVDYAIPVMIYKIVPYNIAGIYAAWRMLLTTAGITISSALAGYLIGHIPSIYILLTAGLFQVYSGIVYFRQIKKFQKAVPASK